MKDKKEIKTTYKLSENNGVYGLAITDDRGETVFLERSQIAKLPGVFNTFVTRSVGVESPRALKIWSSEVRV